METRITEADLAAALEELWRAVWPFRSSLNMAVLTASQKARVLLERYAEQKAEMAALEKAVIAKASGKTR